MGRRDVVIGGLSALAGAGVAGFAAWSYSQDRTAGVATPPRADVNRTVDAPPLYLNADPKSSATVTDQDYAGGADASGVLDATDAIRAAAATGRPVYLPPGTYRFDGPGLDVPSPRILGAGQGATTVNLGPYTYFLDSERRWPQLLMQGIRFNGGLGHIRNTLGSVNVNDLFVVSDCAFQGYSAVAISNISSDHPYWKIQRNIFRSNNCSSSIGIALSGLTDGSTISDNSFLANRVHVKLDRGGNNTYIFDNDFLRFLPIADAPRIDVWFVPAPTDVNSGAGLVITRCKFGNEGLDPADFRIVYADGSAGDQASSWPVLDQESAGWISGHSVRDVLTNGIGDQNPIPMIRSTTSNVVGGNYGPITQAGNSGAPIMSSIRPLAFEGTNQFGPLLRASLAIVPPLPMVVHDG